jgi:signal transduction histidine kinase
MTKGESTANLAEELKKANEALKMMEAHLMQAGKMAALGQLSAGIAHELKQPLTGIMGFVEDALEDAEKDSPVIESLNIIRREADRMQKIVNGIRKFSRASGVEKENININMIIEDSLLLLSKQLANNNIVLETSLAEDLPQVHGNASQLQQVFVNMISNSKDAMESKGEEGKLTVQSGLSNDGKYVEVCFKDTGCGMPKDVIQKLSEPFFTTKGPDKGTGLGTSISFSIIKMHNGEINITSKVGAGTTIILAIPILL